jgi:hypothetical protein
MYKRTFYLLLSLLFSLGLACFVEHDIFFNAFALNDDVRNQVYWMARLINPHFFQHDYIADYLRQPFLVSPFLAVLYKLASLWISPIVFTQFLPLFLVVIATFFLFKLAEIFQDEMYALWLCFSFNCLIWIYKNLAGGLSRAFFYPLFFCLLWAIYSGKWRAVPFILWLSAFIYPPVLLLGLAVLLLEAGVQWKKDAHHSARLKALIIAATGSVFITVIRLALLPHSNPFGPILTRDIAVEMRDIYPGGRIALYSLPYQSGPEAFPFNIFWHLLSMFPQFYILIPSGIIVTVLLLYNKWIKPHVGSLLIPPSLWRILIASGVLYMLAWVFLLYLYVPERYLQYTLPLIPVFIMGGLMYQVHRQSTRFKSWITGGFVLLTLGITSLCWRSDLLNIPNQEVRLYSYLRTLPETSMIAASPGLASNIPLYAFRSVLVSNEAYIPYHRLYFAEMKQRLKDWLSAYYAGNPEPIRALISKYHIDYIVLQKKDFRENRLTNFAQRYYYAFDPAFFEALQPPKAKRYFIMQIPKSYLLYEDASYQIIDAKKFLLYP